MRFTSLLRIGWIVGVVTASSGGALAQDVGYDPEYDDEVAAGTLENASREGPTTEGTPAASEMSPPENSGDTATVDETGAIDGEASASVGDDEMLLSGSAAGAATAADAAAADNKENLPWNWGGRRYFPSLSGFSGLYYIADAASDEMGTFGVGFHGAFFSRKDYLYAGDKNTSVWSGLTLRVTPWDYLEVWLGLDSRANHNDKVQPELFQSLGDFHIGLKGFYPVLDALSLGLLFGFELKNPVGEVSVTMEGTTYPLGVLATLDMGKIHEKVPLKLHLNFIYRFDNSAKLVSNLERDRGGCGTDVNGDGVLDYDGCLNAVERTALEIDRLDQFRIGIGLEASLPYVSPLLEYNIDVPVNRQDFTCPRAEGADNAESCMDQAGIEGMRQWLTIGLRVLPPLKTMSVDLGVEVGLTGYAPSVHELAAQAPYRVILGLTYNFDPFAKPEVKTVQAPCPEPVASVTAIPKTVVIGTVRDVDTNAPLFGAAVVYRNQGVSAQMTGADGKFTSYPFEPGEVTVDVSMDGYESNTFTVTIPEAMDAAEAGDGYGGGAETPPEVTLDCPLKKRVEMGQLNIRVTSDSGDALEGVLVQIENDAQLAKGATDAAGMLPFEGAAGDYTVKVTKEGFFEKRRKVTLVSGTPLDLSIQMSAEPTVPAVELNKKTIRIKKKIMFDTGSGEVAPESYPLLDEVAYTIRSHPEIKLVEIQGHTDDRGKKSANEELSQNRADAVRRYLLGEGVAPSRLTTKGYGSSRPRAPNITASGRASNRRVEFHILESAE